MDEATALAGDGVTHLTYRLSRASAPTASLSKSFTYIFL